MWTRLFCGMMDRLVRTGMLEVHLPDGRCLRFGDAPTPDAVVRITDPVWIGRFVRDPDLALGEAYMTRGIEIDGDDLHGLLAVLLRNAGTEISGRVWWQRLAQGLRKARRRLDQSNGHARATGNVRRHYDLRREFYDLFLDADLQYSCGYFPPGVSSLEEAQQAKKRHIARKLLLRPGMRVLDIGCGWGGLALALAQEQGVHVTGVTLSEEQLHAARARIRGLGLQDWVDVRLLDYRQVEGRFDRIVSVGMFEHVGVPNYGRYFAQVRDLLTDDGLALIHSIGRASEPGMTNPFIARYVFPGGYAPALSEMVAAVERERLWVTDVECLRLHYARTIRHWIDRFDANRAKVDAMYGDAFVRMWRFYLVASEQSFVHDRRAVFQIQLSKRVDTVPITRDYLFATREGDRGEQRMAAE